MTDTDSVVDDVTKAIAQLEKAIARHGAKLTTHVPAQATDLRAVIAAARERDLFAEHLREAVAAFAARSVELNRERDALAAQIAAAREYARNDTWPIDKFYLLGILTADTAEILRERDDRVWNEGLAAGLREANDKMRGVTNNPALSPYRQGADHV